MFDQRGSGDSLFTVFIAVVAALITFVFIAAGAGVAKATFTGHPTEAGERH